MKNYLSILHILLNETSYRKKIDLIIAELQSREEYKF
jgi:hypothetical protein